MKTIASFIFVFLLLVSLNTWCQTAETPNRELRRLEELERMAELKADTATLFMLWSPDYVVNNPGNTIITGTLIKGYIQKGGMATNSFTRDIEKITFAKDVAIVMGSETVGPAKNADKNAKPVTRRFTNVWIRTDKTWQLLARHASNIN